MDERTRYVRLSNERWLRKLKRKGKLHNPLGRTVDGGIRKALGYRSRILDLFCKLPVKGKKKGPPKKIDLPSDFSISRNPDETLRVMREIVKHARTCRAPRLILDHRPIISMGLGADSLLGVILKEVKFENQDAKGSYIRGYKSDRRNIRKIMDEIGCVSVLNSGYDENIRLSLQSSSQVFRHRNRGKVLEIDPLQLDPISETTRDFSDHLDACLALIGRKLTRKGRDRLLSYVGEVLINAQEHSGTAEWTIAGYIDREDQELVYRCVIFSFGASISDTFNSLSTDTQAWKTVEPYIFRHEKSRLFGPSWRRDDLLTVVALQGHVSSKLDENSSRGQGTVDLIQFFQDVSGECGNSEPRPAMNLISGTTSIIFDGRYPMRHVESFGRMVIAFNKDNNLLERPDGDCVRPVRGEGFPGVMISITVPLAHESVGFLSPEAKNEN